MVGAGTAIGVDQVDGLVSLVDGSSSIVHIYDDRN